MKRSIDFYLPERSQYSVLHHFTRQLFAAFQRQDYPCRLIENQDILTLARKDPADMSISFNGAPQLTPGVFLCDVIERPHLTWLVDLPIHYLGLIESPWISIACDDEYSCQWLQQMGFTRHLFLPAAVEREVLSDPQDDREYPVVYFASYFDYEAELRSLPPEVVPLFQEAAEAALTHVDTPFLEELLKAYQNASQVHSYEPLRLVISFEHYLKGRARAELLTSFHEIPVHVFDEKWKNYLQDDFPNIHVHPAISYEETFTIMQHSKVVLNNSIRSAWGGNERIVNAMMCGAIAVTNTNPFIEAYFDTNHELIAYKHEDLNFLEPQIQDLLSQDVKRIAVARLGQKKTLEENTWDDRVNTIMEYFINTF